MIDLFDGDQFRLGAVKILSSLTDDDVEALKASYASEKDLLDEMTARGRSAAAGLSRRGSATDGIDHGLLAAAVLSVRTGLSLQESSGHVARTYEKLVDRGVPVELAAPSRLLDDQDLTGLLIATARATAAVDAETTHPMFVTMVAAALLDGGLTLFHLRTALPAVLARADELAGEHRAAPAPADGADPRFPVLGNADLVGQVAAYRVAVTEAVGASAPPIEELAEKLAARLRRALTRPTGRSNWAGGDEPDIVLVFQAFANVIGGGSAVEEVFRCLHRELTALAVRRPARERQVENDVFDSLRSADAPTAVVDGDEAARRLFEALYAGAGPRRSLVTAWITGARRPDDPAELPFLIDRVRRAAAALGGRSGAASTPAPELRAPFRVLAARVHDAVALNGTVAGIAEAVLPPLWTSRTAAVNLVQSKLRLRIGPGATTRARAALIAAVVVRGPTQAVRRAAPERPAACLCGARGRRVPANRVEVDPEQACPHRPWAEWGVVEDHRTLTEFAEFSSVAATRAQLRRYRGPWEHWVDEVR